MPDSLREVRKNVYGVNHDSLFPRGLGWLGFLLSLVPSGVNRYSRDKNSRKIYPHRKWYRKLYDYLMP